MDYCPVSKPNEDWDLCPDVNYKDEAPVDEDVFMFDEDVERKLEFRTANTVQTRACSSQLKQPPNGAVTTERTVPLTSSSVPHTYFIKQFPQKKTTTPMGLVYQKHPIGISAQKPHHKELEHHLPSIPHSVADRHHKLPELFPNIVNTDLEDPTARAPHEKFVTISTLSFNSYLSPETPLIRLGNTKSPSKKILLIVGVHGDEPCGIIAFNELLREGYFSCIPTHYMVCFL